MGDPCSILGLLECEEWVRLGVVFYMIYISPRKRRGRGQVGEAGREYQKYIVWYHHNILDCSARYCSFDDLFLQCCFVVMADHYSIHMLSLVEPF